MLTPNGTTIAFGLGDTLFNFERQRQVYPTSIEWISKQITNDKTHGINIVGRNFVDTEFTNTVISKNYEN